MASKVKEAAGTIERILLPRLNSIDGELKAINSRIDSVNTRIDSTNERIDSTSERIDSANNSIDEMDKRIQIQFGFVRSEIRSLAERVDLVKDVEKLKVEVAELKKGR
jgi:chromosome segregation ATPase